MSLYEDFKNEIRPKLQKILKHKSIMAVPRPIKIVVNVGLGEALTNPKAEEVMRESIMAITGQYPVRGRAKHDISGFKIRKGDVIGLYVTLRRRRMWDFLEKLIKVVLPRQRDFHGLSSKSFDSNGNYSLGIREHTTFPEIDPAKIDKARGLQVTIHTSAKSKEEGLTLLKALGLPFID